MSRVRDPQQPVKTWSRKYESGRVGMAVPTRGEGVVLPPKPDADILLPHHERPFNLHINAPTPHTASASSIAASSTAARSASPNSKSEPTALRRSLGHSTSSGSILPTLKSPTNSSSSQTQSTEGFTSGLSSTIKSKSMSSSASLPNLLKAIREHEQQRAELTTNLVTSFHSHHVSRTQTATYQFLIQNLSADLDALLDRTYDPKIPPDQEQPLNRARADGCMDLLKQLAAASPNSTTFMALVDELYAAVYNMRDGGMEFREYDPTGTLTFWELAQVMNAKSDDISKDLARIQQRANYYEFHDAGERRVLTNSIRRWQVKVLKIAFGHWRSNIAIFRRQRERLQDIFEKFEARQKEAKITKCFLLWKYQRIRTRRIEIGPQLLELGTEANNLESETNQTNKWINEAINSLKDLTTKVAAFTKEKTQLTEDLYQIQEDLSSFKALKFQDAAHCTLDIARELLLSLQDELEFYADPAGPFTHDGYKIIQKFVPPQMAEKDLQALEKKKGNTKKKKAAAAAAAASATSGSTPDGSIDATDLPSLDSLPSSSQTQQEEWDPIAFEARFASLSDQDILLLWFNYQLQVYHYRPVPNYDEYQLPLYKRIPMPPPSVANFTSDFCSSKGYGATALLQVLEHIAPILNYSQSMNYLLYHEFETDLRMKAMISILGEFNTDVSEIVGSVENLLLNKSPDLVAAFVAKLFCYYPKLEMKKDGLSPCLRRLASMKLERRIVYSRLTKISEKHAEFDAIYIGQRREIEVSRIQANRFLRGMNRQQLLKVHLTNDWNEQAREEEEIRRKEQAARDAILKAEQDARDKIVAEQKAAEEERIRKAKESLGLAIREPTVVVEQPVTVETVPAADDEKDDEDGDEKEADGSPSTTKKKKSRKQLALDHEKERLRQEETAIKAKMDADAEGVLDSNVPEALDPFSPEEAQIYVDYITKFATEFHTLYVEAKKQMDRIRRGEQMYRVLLKRMENFVLDVLVRRVNQDPLPIIDHKAHRDYLAFTTVSATRISELLPTDPIAQQNEILLLQGELATDYTELCSIFRAYSRVDHTTDQPLTDSPIVAQGCLLMHFSDFGELLKDLKLQSRNVKQAAMDAIYETCTEGDVVSSIALSPNQFVEAIVRLSALKYSMSSLADSVAIFLKQDLLKKCKKLVPDLLRSKFQTNEFLEMLRKHRRKLRKVFQTYAAGNGHNLCTIPSAERHTIDIKDFTNILKFAKLLGGGEGLSMDDIQTVFVNVKRSEYITCDNPPTDPELNRLDYTEFCQALAALSMYKNPDPFTTFLGRFDHFLTRDFFPSNK